MVFPGHRAADARNAHSLHLLHIETVGQARNPYNLLIFCSKLPLILQLDLVYYYQFEQCPELSTVAYSLYDQCGDMVA
jgi:hypothetical protein